jgi:hypothetical protein
MSDKVMADPAPENIEGSKIVTHKFDHGINWEINLSHVFLAVAILAALWFLSDRLGGDDQDEQSSLSAAPDGSPNA